MGHTLIRIRYQRRDRTRKPLVRIISGNERLIRKLTAISASLEAILGVEVTAHPITLPLSPDQVNAAMVLPSAA